jgi:hypothetical protein
MEAKMARYIIQILAPANMEADELMEELTLVLEDQSDCEIISVELDEDQTGVNGEN